MPAPNPPTDLTQTVVDGSPLLELDWDHDGANLDRFELLYRLTDSSDPWTRALLAPKGDFGTGPYSTTVTTREGMTWVVRAISASGEVSV